MVRARYDSFIQIYSRILTTTSKCSKKIEKSTDKKQDSDLELKKYTNQLIEKLNNHLSKFNYNVIVANMHETYSFLIKIIEKNISKKELLENYKKILAILSPVIPHLVFECLKSLNFDVFQSWPQVDKEMLVVENVKIVVQINGKKEVFWKCLRT